MVCRLASPCGRGLTPHASSVPDEDLFSDSERIKNARRSAIALYRLHHVLSTTTVANRSLSDYDVGLEHNAE